MKSNVTRTLEGLSEACDALSVCARFDPSSGYSWKFDSHDDDDEDDKFYSSMQEKRKRRRRQILDNRRPGER
jgi:hypothetical protein